MAGRFARLKLRLIRNGLRSAQYRILFGLGATGAAMLAFFGFVALASMRGDPSAADVTIVVFAGLTMLWTIVPLLGFGTDETLDPQRLALLPLGTGEMLRGLLAAALVGVAPIATVIALTGAVVGLAHDLIGAILVFAAVVANLVLCVTASRTLIAVLAPLLRSRRGRDVTIMTIALVTLVPQALRLFALRGGSTNARQTIATVADRVRFAPFGLGGLAATEGADGNVLLALGALALVGVTTALLLWIWARAIPRAMVTADLAAPARSERRARANVALFPRWLPFLPRTRAGATAAKELRYYVRDPRRRAPLITALIIPGVFMVDVLRDGHTRSGATTLLALVALLPASGLTLNQFGLDGAALWCTVVAGNDVRSDLTGKNAATALVVFPLVAVPACVIAAITHGWGYVPVTIGLAPAMLGVLLGIGNIVSAWAPYALPERQNPLAASPGQGCVGAVAALGALAIDAILLVPVAIVVGMVLTSMPLPVATPLAIAISGAYGGGAWLAGRFLASRHLWWRMPELLDAVSPRQAG